MTCKLNLSFHQDIPLWKYRFFGILRLLPMVRPRPFVYLFALYSLFFFIFFGLPYPPVRSPLSIIQK